MVELLTVILEHYGNLSPVITDRNFTDLFTPEPWENIFGAVVDCHLQDSITGFDILAYLKNHHPHIKRVAFTAMDISQEDLGDLATVVLKPSLAAGIVKVFNE